MGREASVTYVAGRERVLVKAHLGSLDLQLTGAKKLKVAFADVTSVVVDGDVLRIATKAGAFALQLGAREAELWRKKILSPPSLGEKLGIKPDKSVVLIGDLPPEVVEAADAAKTVTSAVRMPKIVKADIAVLQLKAGQENPNISAAARAVPSGAAVWFVYVKGGAVNGDDIIGLARKAGLKDTKVARISDSHAALRFIKAVT